TTVLRRGRVTRRGSVTRGGGASDRRGLGRRAGAFAVHVGRRHGARGERGGGDEGRETKRADRATDKRMIGGHGSLRPFGIAERVWGCARAESPTYGLSIARFRSRRRRTLCPHAAPRSCPSLRRAPG